ncbi:hypothetical protein [Pseudomonas fluorescens]|uniref:hypothetical protein n=1 Tax=Pseudomonas fluorescens TaxID=294 RepID=UPI00321FE15B
MGVYVLAMIPCLRHHLDEERSVRFWENMGQQLTVSLLKLLAGGTADKWVPVSDAQSHIKDDHPNFDLIN